MNAASWTTKEGRKKRNAVQAAAAAERRGKAIAELCALSFGFYRGKISFTPGWGVFILGVNSLPRGGRIRGLDSWCQCSPCQLAVALPTWNLVE